MIENEPYEFLRSYACSNVHSSVHRREAVLKVVNARWRRGGAPVRRCLPAVLGGAAQHFIARRSRLWQRDNILIKVC
jgi:hypothetical protein